MTTVGWKPDQLPRSSSEGDDVARLYKTSVVVLRERSDRRPRQLRQH
jgi:hypothetical protein